MTRKLLTMVLFAFTLLITSCGDSQCYTKLEEVDSLTEKDLVDSARNVLTMIERTYKIENEKERAYYNLLKYQLGFRLRYKNMKDTIIDYCISYYSAHDDNRKLALAYYLKGRIKAKENNNRAAIKCLKRAEIFAEKTDNNLLKMRICNNIAIINYDNEDYIAALNYELRAIEYGKKTDDKETFVMCLLNAAAYYGNTGKPDSCSYYAIKSLDYIKEMPPATKASIYLNVAASIEDTDTARAKEYAWKSIELGPSNNAYQVLAKIARDGKDYRLSEEYLNEALKYSKSVDWEAFILYELAQTKELMGQHEEANKLSRRVIKLRDSVETIKARDSIREIQATYEMEDKAQGKIEAKEDEKVAIATVMGLVIVLTVTVLVLKRRKARKDMELMQQEHRKEIREKEQEKSRGIEAANRKMERQQVRLESKAERQRQQDSETYRDGFAIYNKVKSGEGKINWDKETIRSFVSFYRSITPGFKHSVEGRYPKLTEYQYVLLALKDMGMDNKQTAATLGITVSAVRTQLSRMKKAAEETVG